ncbi:MAG TPA: hypothetical protein VH857_09850, partial [Actinomycetes bacterium]|nr:hypothetical protein [Actinomycetes bacterium]
MRHLPRVAKGRKIVVPMRESVFYPADAPIRRLADDREPVPFWEDWLDPYARQDAAEDGRDPVWPPVGMLAQFAAGPLLAAMLAEANLTPRAACPDELVVEIAAAAARLQAWAASVELAATGELTERVADWRGVATKPDDRHVS